MLHEVVRGNEIVVINDDAGMGKDGGGRAGIESNELKAKLSGLSVASNFAAPS